MDELQAAKTVVLDANRCLDAAGPSVSAAVLSNHVTPDYRWRGMHPFHEQTGATAVVDVYWTPLKSAFGQLLRRSDIFLAGLNQLDDWRSTWVVDMGHLMGLWDESWLALSPATIFGYLTNNADGYSELSDGAEPESA